MKFYRVLQFGVLFLLAAGIAAAQDKPPQEDPPPRPKVWTNDEIAQARRPVDLYLDQKQAAEESRKAAAEKAKKEVKESCKAPARNKEQNEDDDSRMPKTLEDTAERIEAKQYEIEGQEELVKSTEQEYFFASFDEREGLHQKLLRLKSDLASARAELAALEAWREKFSSTEPE
jgi:hypothetical protein